MNRMNRVRGLNCGNVVLELGLFVTREKTRLQSVSSSGGAKKAIWKSREPFGEDGVTIIAGSAASSSTRGFERSKRAWFEH